MDTCESPTCNSHHRRHRLATNHAIILIPPPSLECSYELSDHLVGNIALTGVTAPVLLIKLAVVRIECADGEVRALVMDYLCGSMHSGWRLLLHSLSRLCVVRLPEPYVSFPHAPCMCLSLPCCAAMEPAVHAAACTSLLPPLQPADANPNPNPNPSVHACAGQRQGRV